MIRDLIRALSPHAWAAVALGVAAAVVILIVVVLSWGQSRFDAGVTDTDARWVEAGRRLEEQAATSADAADRREAPRIENHAAQVAAEKEKIDEAVAAGSSPLDALFGVRADTGRRASDARP